MNDTLLLKHALACQKNWVQKQKAEFESLINDFCKNENFDLPSYYKGIISALITFDEMILDVKKALA